MSEPKLISPMLDGCMMGQAISSHHGVSCYPVIQKSTGEKYIVKVISIPASSVQLDALLLTGAYPDAQSADAYFSQCAKDILQEHTILERLSRQEGFCPYIQAQIVPMDEGVGYDVYLLGAYRQTADKLFDGRPLTQLDVLNMGLDLCSALAACRRAGQLYVDLKPGNIFNMEGMGYHIGDLGFIPLSALSYTSLPEKYHSPYIPAEALDPMAVLNETVDTYALGMILYQAYNGGALPGTSQPFLSPAYADYEISEILLKALAPDPRDRWQDPAQLGQALVSYMQRNAISDAPIIPVPAEEPEEPQEEVEDFLPEEDYLAELEDVVDPTVMPEEVVSAEDFDRMMAQADALIAHELPEPPVAPEPVEIPMPEPIVLEPAMPEPVPEEEPEPEPVPVPEITEEAPQEPEAAADEAPAPLPQPTVEKEKNPRRAAVVALSLLLILLLSCLGLGGWYAYENYYLQNIDQLILTGSDDSLTVQVVSNISEEKLSVVLTDSYGNAVTEPVAAGIAIFTDLDPDTHYTVKVKIQGLHKLTGHYSSSYSTSPQTTISSFTAGIGDADGTVRLSFTVSGPDSTAWILLYSAEGMEEQSLVFTGHSISVPDLSIGLLYTFTLTTEEYLTLNGQTQVSFTPAPVTLAQDLQIPACGGGSLTATWAAPEGVTVSSWIVRCYNTKGYDKTVTTSDTRYTFTGLEHDSDCTVEVTAAGMRKSVSATVKANPIKISTFRFSTPEPQQLQIQWDFEGKAPVGGWVLQYTVDGSSIQEITSEETAVTVEAVSGGVYSFILKAADGATVFGGITSYQMPESQDTSQEIEK